MARPRIKSTRPDWFDLEAYDEASAMDGADWYLNLRLRGEDQRHLGLIDLKTPVLRRDQLDGTSIGFMLHHTSELPAACHAIINGREPESSVHPLSVSAFYRFERDFPEEVRRFGKEATFPVMIGQVDVPDAFLRSVDDVHGPNPSKQMLGRFARIDLSRPDKVLKVDFERYLAEQRAALEAIPGRHPYGVALNRLAERNRLSLDSLVKHAVLPFIDIEQWRVDTGATITKEAFVEILEIKTESRLDQTRKYADLLLQNLVLNGWLLPLACEAMRTPQPD